jgi:hypothetical protein
LGLIKRKRKEVQSLRKINDKELMTALYKGSIVWESFVCNRNSYSTIKKYTL